MYLYMYLCMYIYNICYIIYTHMHSCTRADIHMIHVGRHVLSKASLPNEEEKRPRLPPNPRYCAWVNIPRLRWFLVRFKLFISHGEHPQATHSNTHCGVKTKATAF